MGRIDLQGSPAKYTPPGAKAVRCDVVDRAFDTTKSIFVLLIRRHDNGELSTVPASHVTVGAKPSDLGA